MQQHARLTSPSLRSRGAHEEAEPWIRPQVHTHDDGATIDASLLPLASAAARAAADAAARSAAAAVDAEKLQKAPAAASVAAGVLPLRVRRPLRQAAVLSGARSTLSSWTTTTRRSWRRREPMEES